MAVVLGAVLGAGSPARAEAPGETGRTPDAVLAALGVPRRPDAVAESQRMARAMAVAIESGALRIGAPGALAAGLRRKLPGNAPFSAALATTVQGAGSSSSRMVLLADWDGREDLVADRQLVVTAVGAALAPLSRVAQSAHTIANGFAESIFYAADTVGNVYVLADTTGDGLADTATVINLPTVANAFGVLSSDSQIVVTGLAVNPVADLTAFTNVNGAYDEFDGQIGEILYVGFWDTGGGTRLIGSGEIVRSGLLAFPIADVVSAAAAAPSPISVAGFPVTVGGAFGVIFTPFANLGGVAVDDSGDVYFHQVDLVRFTAANIVKVASLDSAAFQDRALATSGILTLTTLNPPGGVYGTTSGPVDQINRVTNYSGTSKAFGNVVALAAGQGNALFAALAASFNPDSPEATQARQGLFTNSNAIGPTPSMIVSFADYRPSESSLLPVPDGFADVIDPALALVPGLTNIRAFVLGVGPDRRGSEPAFGTKDDTLKVALDIDYTLYSGLAVDESRNVYVVSGGTPAGVGRNPSPARAEILVFPDVARADRRADFIDLRSDAVDPFTLDYALDEDSDRFDHLFWQAPLDQRTLTPIAVAGLATGFLRYLNRTAPNAIANLPSGTPQANNEASGPIAFDDFDPSGRLGGGDDTEPPFRGDDLDGFEFVFGANIGAVCTSPHTSFFLNANGSVSFGAGSTDPTPTGAEFRAGPARLAAAWANLNPEARSVDPRAFPVQALGFAGVNHFRIRWINVPLAGQVTTSNTFAISLFDDGTGQDEGQAEGTLEGPTDPRSVPGNGVAKRPNGSGYFVYEYGGMDLFADDAATRVVVGWSAGELPASPAQVNIGNGFENNLIGVSTDVMVFEVFDTGDYDLRFEGAHREASSPLAQPDPNRERRTFRGRRCP
jgi:hypothetical protein